MLPGLLTLRRRVRFALRQVAVASGAGALVLAGLSLLGSAGIVWLSARYGVLIGLSAAGGALVLCGLLVFLLARPKPTEAVVEVAPAAEAALPGGGVAGVAEMMGPALIGQAGTALRAARAVLPDGSGAVTTQLARRPVKAVAAAVAFGAVLGLVQATRRSGAATRTVLPPDREA